MNWDAIAAVGELLGAAGVIASLVYLAGQVRSSGFQSRQAAIQSVVNKTNDVWLTATSGRGADVWARGSKGMVNLEGESEEVQFSALMLSIFKPYEELFHYRSDGQVDEWVWESIHSVCHALMATPGFQDWWERRSSWFSADFQAHVATSRETPPGYGRHEQGSAGAF